MTLKIIQSKTKHNRLAEQENTKLKNCGTRQLKTPPTKCPNILLGIANIVIKNNGLIIKLFVSRYFSIILILNMLEIVIDRPSPMISAFTPKYLGKNMIEKIIKILPRI